MRLFTAALVSALLAACAHTAVIETQPEGAHVFVDGEYLGASPVALRNSLGTRSYALEITKTGYTTVSTTLEQTKLNAPYTAGACAAGVGLAGCGFLAGLFTSIGWSTCLWGGAAAGAAGLVTSAFYQKELADRYEFVLEEQPEADDAPPKVVSFPEEISPEIHEALPEIP